MSEHHGRFVWYELMADDTKAAGAFYADVAGWEVKPSGMPGGMDYSIFWAGPAMIGGLMTVPEEARAMGARPAWVGYVGVDDVDAYATRVADAGGRVIREPADIPDVGRFAVVADPHGAVFLLFRGEGEAAPAHDQSAPGHVGWHELMAGDLDADFSFYATLFGWTKTEAHDMGAMGVYQIFAAGGQTLGGMMTHPPQVPAAHWRYYINVPAIDDAIARVAAGGGQIVNGPMQVPGGSWIVQGLDPQGAFFALVAPTR